MNLFYIISFLLSANRLLKNFFSHGWYYQIKSGNVTCLIFNTSLIVTIVFYKRTLWCCPLGFLKFVDIDSGSQKYYLPPNNPRLYDSSFYYMSYVLIICCYHCCGCSVAQLCLTLCDPMACSRPGLPVPHHVPKFAQAHVHWVSDAV